MTENLEATSDRPRADVVIVVAPVANASCPAFGPSLLVSRCRELGLSAVVLYGTVELAARVGLERYNALASAFNEALTGESLFRAAAFPDAFDAAAQAEFVARHVAESSRTPDLADLDTVFRTGNPTHAEAAVDCARHVEPFLDAFSESILAHSPKIVGFSSVFQQNLASLALARRIKERDPDLITVIGGPNLSSPMAEAVASFTDRFDVVFSGEADHAFPELCRRLLEGGELPGETVLRCSPLRDLDRAPAPDYDDYFRQIEPHVAAGTFPSDLPLWLHVETSRGCWWGERSPCAFCALNGPQMRHRHKSAPRVLGELASLKRRYGVSRFQITDNIVPHSMRDELVPLLAREQNGYDLFMEVRPDLSAPELDRFFRAGIRNLQPGIESLASNVLRQLRKGTTGPRNIAFLRDCTSRGIVARWNLLVRIPGERRSDYEDQLRLFPLVEHLQPPGGWGPIRLDRFSQYEQAPSDHGLQHLRPFPSYASLYPEDAPLDRLACHFVADYTTELFADPDLLTRFAAGLLRWVAAWTESPHPPRLMAVPLGAGLELIEDTRSAAVERYWVVTPPTAATLARLVNPRPERLVSDEDRTHLEPLLERGLVVQHEGFVLSVVTRHPSGILPLEVRP